MPKLALRIVATLAALSSSPALLAAPAPCGGQKDFLVRSDPLLAPVRPQDCTTHTQTPPEFTWPPQDGNNTYSVIVTYPDGRSETRATTKNWLLWDQPLPAGTYSWQVKVAGKYKDQSQARKFTIAPNAVPFVVPDGGAILARARSTAHPRTWPRDATSPLAALKAERAKGFAGLLQDIDNDEKRTFEAEPASGSKNSNYDDTVVEHKRTVAAALAYAATRDQKYGENAARRLMRQARWSATGLLSHANNDMANRTVAWTLALGYDWLHDYLSDSQKASIRAAIRARTQPMFADILPRITASPYDSHGNVTLNTVAAIGALMAGDIPEADEWVKEAVPAAVAWTSPWGAQDGGFGNGTTQAFWDAGSNLPTWYILRNAAGVDLAKKEWVRNHAAFMAYFTPPGAPSGNFGDGQEMKLDEVWSRVSEAYARFAPGPLSRWYAKQQSGHADVSRLELLLAPRVELNPAAFPADTPDAALFPAIGWAAMHSSLADPNRASVYFRSSPYGSYNHSHADQNSFVVNHKGRRLAIASGYYDDYDTKHWKEWYKQTRSANAITFDGGKGQGYNDRAASGEITKFASNAVFDYAVGHAEKAYGGALTKAQRTLVYLRPNVVLVHDSVASATPHTWEWNIHALNPMTQVSEQKILIRNGPAQMCVEMLAGPEVSFDQTDKFSAPPQGRNMPNEWHGTFATRTRSPSAEFVALLRIGSDCSEAKSVAAAKRTGSEWNITVDGKTVSLAGENVAVK